MLRRGLALCDADVAVVTNVSADHFGEYGIHDLDDLAAAKLTVARAIGDDGLLVLNGDDVVLRRQAEALACPKGWFVQDFDAPLPAAHREAGGATCRSEEHTSELQSLMRISYAVFCLKKKNRKQT